MAAGTQFTGFTSTNLQSLTTELAAAREDEEQQRRRYSVYLLFTGTKVQMLTPLRRRREEDKAQEQRQAHLHHQALAHERKVATLYVSI
jgi:hypothetical protein